jgi:hypothetical protein
MLYTAMHNMAIYFIRRSTTVIRGVMADYKQYLNFPRNEKVLNPRESEGK